jgi:hypothetical protein
MMRSCERKLTVRARRIDLAEAVLPKTPPNRQQRIVVDDDRAIFPDLTDARALKLRLIFRRRAYQAGLAHR